MGTAGHWPPSPGAGARGMLTVPCTLQIHPPSLLRIPQGTSRLCLSSSVVMMGVFSTRRSVFKHSRSQRHPVTQVTCLLHAANLAAAAA